MSIKYKVCHQVSQICGIHRGLTNLVIGGLPDVMVNNLDPIWMILTQAAAVITVFPPRTWTHN